MVSSNEQLCELRPSFTSDLSDLLGGFNILDLYSRIHVLSCRTNNPRFRRWVRDVSRGGAAAFIAVHLLSAMSCFVWV